MPSPQQLKERVGGGGGGEGATAPTLCSTALNIARFSGWYLRMMKVEGRHMLNHSTAES